MRVSLPEFYLISFISWVLLQDLIMYESTNIIKEILIEFNLNNLDYAIIRNYDFLIDDTVQVGKDVDIVIDNVNLKKFADILLRNGFIKQPISPYSSHSGYWKYVLKEKKLIKFHFHIDGLSGNSVPYLDSKKILERRKKIDSFYVISDEDLLINLLFHSKLNGDKARYAPLVSKLRKKDLDTSYVFNSVKEILGKNIAIKMFHGYKDLNFEKLDSLKPEIKKSLVKRNLFPIAKMFLLSSLWKVSRLIKPSPLVCFIGMDGSGKSTVTKNLSQILEDNKISYSLVYTGRGRNHILPIKYFGKKYRKHENKKVEKDKVSKKSLKKKIIYSLAAPVFMLDLYLRYLKYIFPKRRTNEIVVVDRYATDILLMDNVNESFKKILYSLFPRSNLVVYLYNDPKVLYSRKPEHPRGDLERQEKLFSQIIPTLGNVKKIKSVSENQTLEESSQLIFDKLLNS